LGFLAKLSEGEAAFIQILLRVPYSQDSLQKRIRGAMQTDAGVGKTESNPYSKLLTEKLATPVLESQLRLVFSGRTEREVKERLTELAGSYGIYTLSEGNSFTYTQRSNLFKRTFFKKIIDREFSLFAPKLLLNLDEIASLWHLPDKKFEKIKNIDWGKTYLSEAPDNLPVAPRPHPHSHIGYVLEHKDSPENAQLAEEKREINFFCQN